MCIVQTKASVDTNQPGTMRARLLGFRHVTAPAKQYTPLKDKFAEAADNGERRQVYSTIRRMHGVRWIDQYIL